MLASSTDVYGVFTHGSRGAIILNNFSGDFNKEVAIDTLMKLYPNQMYTNITDWGEDEFISFLINNYTTELWNKLP